LFQYLTFLFIINSTLAQPICTFSCWIPLDTLTLPNIARWSNIRQDTQTVLQKNLPLFGALPQYLIENATSGKLQIFNSISNKPINKDEVIPYLEEYCCMNKNTSLKSLNFKPYSRIISVTYQVTFHEQSFRFLPSRIYLYEYLPESEQPWIERAYLEIESPFLKNEIIKKLELNSGKSNWQLWIE
ncbi:MAG: hypothetical protein EBS07_11245, partial [Sphingobacteriia bacterium]|nr:hypothetical protein [Sphingobacteriia bacterium]